MVRKNENMMVNANSLLKTATSKRFGPGRFAALVARGNTKPPIKKVKFICSESSGVSDLTASVVERPAFVKEVKVDDIEVESSIFGMSMQSRNSSYFGKGSPLVGDSKQMKPQPRVPRQLPPRHEGGKPVGKKRMDMHRGITFSSPSPMTLDRVQVQMSQERSAPPSQDWKRQDEERQQMIRAELEKRDKRKVAKEVVQKMNEEYHDEIGEGFEAQLEDVDFESSNQKKKKSLFKKVLGKIMPKKPLTEFQAREIARKAMLKSKGNGEDPLPLPPHHVPFELITVNEKEETVSDLDSLVKMNFPVEEVFMKDGDDSRDDSSISSIGTQHILERMGPGPLMSRHAQRDARDPTPTEELVGSMRNEMFMPPEAKKKSTPALIDRIDSGNLTEDARGKHNSKPFGFLAAAMCSAPSGNRSVADKILESPKEDENNDLDKSKFNDHEKESEQTQCNELNRDSDQIESNVVLFSNAIQEAESRIKQKKDERELKKTLSPIEECEDMSPRAASDGQDPQMESTPKTSSLVENGEEVIDLTAMASPKSPEIDGGMKDGVFSFDDIMDIAEDKLNRKKNDKYAVEGEESPTQQTSDTQKQKPEVVSPQSSFEVCKNPEGDIVMWSEGNTPAVEKQYNPEASKKELNGPFSDHLFDLLSTDESVSRGRKKVPFLKEQRSADTEVTVDEACMFDLSMGGCGKKNSKKHMGETDLRRKSAEDTTRMGPDVGVMCGAVPLYFMYKDKGEHHDLGELHSKEQVNDNEIIEENLAKCERAPKEMDCDLRDFHSKQHAGGNGTIEENPANCERATTGTDHDLRELHSKQHVGDNDKTEENLASCERAPPISHFSAETMMAEDKPEFDNAPKSHSPAEDAITRPPESPVPSENKLTEETPEFDNSPKSRPHVENIVTSKRSAPTRQSNQPNQAQYSQYAEPKNEDVAVRKLQHPPALLQGQETGTEEPTSSDKNPVVQKTKVKVLLDKDDAYWDTLSTIASTKDRSAGSCKFVAEKGGEPGPIPVEITMEKKTNPNESDARQFDPADFSHDLVCLVEESSSAESLSRQLAALSSSRDPPMKTNYYTSDDSPRDSPVQPLANTKSRERVRETRVDLGEEDSVDNSQLLLAVTRSEGEDEPPGTNPPDNEAKTATSNNAASGGWQVRGYGKPFRIETAAKPDEKEGLHSYLPEHPMSTSLEQNQCSSMYYPQSFLGGLFSPGMAHQGSRIQSLSANDGIVNPPKNPPRSVSWGFEEIFEAFSPTSPTSLEERAVGIKHDDVPPPEPRVPSPYQDVPGARSPTSNSTPSTSLESTQLSVQDEEALISRTLQLSRQLLSSMSIHDLEGADGEIVESLLINFSDENNSRGQSHSTNPRVHSLPQPELHAKSRCSGLRQDVTSAPKASTTAISSKMTNRRAQSSSFMQVLGGIPEVESSREDEFGDIPHPGSGRSEDSPIDVEALFSKYDTLANHFLGQNAVLQDKAVDRNDENTTVSSSSPIINSRLDELRAQRAKAIAKLHGGPEYTFRGRAQSTGCKKGHDYSSKSDVAVGDQRTIRLVDAFPRQRDRGAVLEDFETTSTRSDLTTPSMKARELRRQLDDALQASREIRDSQERLGSELKLFKDRFYSKNGSLEDRASKAIGGF